MERSEYEISHGIDPFSFAISKDVAVDKTTTESGGGSSVTTFSKGGKSIVSIHQYTSSADLAAGVTNKGTLVNRPYQVGGAPAELYQDNQGNQNIIVPSKFIWIYVPGQSRDGGGTGGWSSSPASEIITTIKFASDESET